VLTFFLFELDIGDIRQRELMYYRSDASDDELKLLLICERALMMSNMKILQET
jgi:hypothetical protein